MTTITFRAVNPRAKLPTYGSLGAAAFDFYSTQDGSIRPRSSAVIKLGLQVCIPDGYAMFIFSRSGMGFERGVRLANCVGVIDADYRGEIMVKLHNDSEGHYHFAVGDRIAQAVILPAPQVSMAVTTDELPPTRRGAGGFGSTGA